MKLITTCCIALLAGSALAKEHAEIDLAGLKHPVKPMLWKVEGKGLEQPSYLFGTIHLADKRLTTLHPVALKAFDQAECVYTEVDLSIASQMKMVGLFMRKDKNTLQQLVGDDLYAAVNDELKVINPALNAKPFDQFKVWAIGVMLPVMKDQLSGALPLDVQLWNRAAKAGKKTGALESMDEQVGKLDQLTIEEQIHLLDVTIKFLKKARQQGIDPYKELVDAYLRGDTGAIEEIYNKDSYLGIKMDPKMLKKFYRLMLDERNVSIKDSILKAFAENANQSSFFAAGAAHYIGDTSVIKLLEDAGYKITRM